MKIALADIHWQGHHTPYVSLISEHLIQNGHQVIFITDENHKRTNELPKDELFQINKLTVPTPELDIDNGFGYSVIEQAYRTYQISLILATAMRADADVLHFLWFDRTLVPYRAATLVDDYAFSVIATLHRDSFTTPSKSKNIKSITRTISTISLRSVIKHGTLNTLVVHADRIKQRIVQQIGSAYKENIHVIPAPTPEISINHSKKEARGELGLPSDREILLFFGGLRYEKGPDLLGEALAELNRNVTVVFAGSPVDFDRDDLTRWENKASKSVNIISHLEFIPESRIELYFVAADALILPYRRQRGISGPMRRACMAGTPVVGTQNSDIGEIIDRYDLGETFTHGSSRCLCRAVNTVLNTDKNYESKIKKYNQTRHWESTGRSLEQLYLEVSKSNN